jgi:molybdate transport system substrate-binding protein
MVTRRTAAVRLALLALLLPGLPACGDSRGAERGPVVLAASSLQESFEAAAEAWAAQGNAAPVLSFAASSALARQIELGAPADLFVAADGEWMDTLSDQGLVLADTRTDLLGNRLVLVTRKGGAVRHLADLGDGRLALADPAAVPAGKYARAALESLGQWQAVAANVVPAENVRAALALVERGEAALGIVYTTDAMASAEVDVLETLPEESHPPIRYPAAVLAESRHPDARRFLNFLSSDEGRRIFARHGFAIAEHAFGILH